MILVVLDTNIIVSALLQPLGPPARVFVLSIGSSIQLCISGSVYAEYEEVISRPRLQRSEEIVAAALHAIREKGFWVRPTETIRACSDPDDDVFFGMRPRRPSRLFGDRQSQALPHIVVRDANRHSQALAGRHLRWNRSEAD